MQQSKAQFDIDNIVGDTAKQRRQCTGLLEKMGNNLLFKTAIQTGLEKGGRNGEDEEENDMRGHVVQMTGGWNQHRIVQYFTSGLAVLTPRIPQPQC